MTTVSSPAATSTPESTEVTAIDRTARFPLLLLLASGLAWLLIGGLLALVPSIQLHAPAFLDNIPYLTHGRATALAESAFVYGWAANAGWALVLWILGRLGGAPLRAANWVLVGTLFWNTGVAIGLIGIAFGQQTSIPLLQLPSYIQPLLLVSYGALAVAGVLAWTGRDRAGTYAAQWYGVASLFLFPWLFSVAQVMLLWAPVRGVMQAIVAGWFQQGVWTLWLFPLMLSAAYYIVPKVSGRMLPSYEFSTLGFWTLLIFGGWTGGRHLIGGPVPAWISSIAIVACSLLLFHYFVVGLNLRGALFRGSLVLGFMAVGLAAYILGGVVDAITSIRSVAKVVQFTYFDQAGSELGLFGVVTTIFSGAIYFMLPRVLGRMWASTGLIWVHFILMIVGTLLLVGNLAAAGLVQGLDLNDPKISFLQIAADTHTYLVFATVARVLLLVSWAALAANFVGTLFSGPKAVESAWVRSPAKEEVYAS